MELKLAKYLQLIGTMERTIFRKVRKETILKLCNTLVLRTFLYGSENWTLTASQRQRIEAAEMKLLRPLAGHTFNDHKTNDSIRRELRTDCILDKIDEYRRNWLYTCKECHKTESLWNHTTTAHKEREQLGDRRNDGESNCNSGDGTGQMTPLCMFMMIMNYCSAVIGEAARPASDTVPVPVYCRGPYVIAALSITSL